MIVGIDVGTQSLKVVVTDANMSILGHASCAYQPSFPRPGWSEQDPRLWEEALAPTIAKALAAAGVDAAHVAAIGLGGQLDGCIGINGEGIPVYPCLIWMDRRAEKEIAGLPADPVRERAGIILDATHLAAKIRWIKGNLAKENEPLRFHVPVSYLVFRLTGNHAIDHGTASTTMLYSLKDRGYDPWLLDLFGIQEDELPLIRGAMDCAGRLSAQGARLTGLAEGTPLAVGTGDDFSTPLGAGMVRPGRLACVLGTAEVVGALHTEPVIDGDGLVETHAYQGDTYYIENPGWLSGGALAWFKETWGLADFKQLDALAGQVPPGAEGLTFLPALSGAMAPEWIASARACFYGLTPAHGKSHMARAVLEGTAFAMRDVAERLRRMGVDINSISVLGGGAKSRVWAGIRADLTGLPVEIPFLADTAPVGSAILASVAAGIQPDLLTAAKKVGGIKETIDPDPAVKAAYDDAYDAYHRLFKCLRPMYGIH